jgi:hypothetical protein
MHETIFYHEDSYRQIDLIPEENYFSSGKVIEGLSQDDQAAFGFSKMIVRPTEPTRLLDRKILFKELKTHLDPLSLAFSDKVSTGYGQYSSIAENIVVWGFEQYGIFVKVQSSLVEAMWLADSFTFPQDKKRNSTN